MQKRCDFRCRFFADFWTILGAFWEAKSLQNALKNESKKVEEKRCPKNKKRASTETCERIEREAR